MIKKEILYYGERWASIHHSRLRLGCSVLRAHLFENLHVIDNGECRCGEALEDTSHFLLNCPNYIVQRNVMINIVARISEVSTEILLNGNPLLSIEDNKVIFGAVHQFIVDSSRFV